MSELRCNVFRKYTIWKQSNFQNKSLQDSYSKLKSQYHIQIRKAKDKHNREELENKLDEINENGMSKAYKFFKNGQAINTVDLQKI